MAGYTKCPMCMTKMVAKEHDLVCPVCGYKYCGERKPYTYDDHDHNQYRSYTSQKTYSTPTPSATSREVRPTGAVRTIPKTSNPRSSHSTTTVRREKKKQSAPFVIKLAFIYIIIIFVKNLVNQNPEIIDSLKRLLDALLQ